MKYLPYILFGLSCLFISCDDDTGTSGPGDTGGRDWCLWIGADKDTYTSCGRTGACEEGDQNFGTAGQLVVADWELAKKRIYVHFMIPDVPEGSEVLEAYLELYHSGTNEDGKRDDITIPVAHVPYEWSPKTLTWNNTPAGLPGHDFTLSLRSTAWSPSPDITTLVQGYLDDPDTHKGFMLVWKNNGLGIEKGFYSNNHIYRKVDDLWLSPRLLVKVRLPESKSISDVTLPPFPPDDDIPFDGEETLMLRYGPGNEWPSDWDVAEK